MFVFLCVFVFMYANTITYICPREICCGVVLYRHIIYKESEATALATIEALTNIDAG